MHWHLHENTVRLSYTVYFVDNSSTVWFLAQDPAAENKSPGPERALYDVLHTELGLISLSEKTANHELQLF